VGVEWAVINIYKSRPEWAVDGRTRSAAKSYSKLSHPCEDSPGFSGSIARKSQMSVPFAQNAFLALGRFQYTHAKFARPGIHTRIGIPYTWLL